MPRISISVLPFNFGFVTMVCFNVVKVVVVNALSAAHILCVFAHDQFINHLHLPEGLFGLKSLVEDHLEPRHFLGKYLLLDQIPGRVVFFRLRL